MQPPPISTVIFLMSASVFHSIACCDAPFIVPFSWHRYLNLSTRKHQVFYKPRRAQRITAACFAIGSFCTCATVLIRGTGSARFPIYSSRKDAKFSQRRFAAFVLYLLRLSVKYFTSGLIIPANHWMLNDKFFYLCRVNEILFPINYFSSGLNN